jgi:cation:H+ antiporter
MKAPIMARQVASTTGRLALCGGYAALAVVGLIINRRHLLATLRAPFEWADDDSGESTLDGRELVPAGR